MLLNLQNIEKIYHTGKVDFQALHDINLSVEKGEFTALCGPSGSGKTTLLNIIGCIDNPTNGEIFLEGMSVTKKSPKDLAYLRREYYGFIFQTYNLIPVLSIYENVELPLRLLKKYNEFQMKDMVYNVLEKVGLKGFEKRYPLEVSGGQQQRVSIARALVKNPKVILADEPTANLDSANGEAIVNLMREMNEKDGVTFIFSTHDQMVMKYARRLVKLHDGRIVEDLKNS